MASRNRKGQRGNTFYRYSPSPVLPGKTVYNWQVPREMWLSDNPYDNMYDLIGPAPSDYFTQVEDNRRWNPDRRPKTVTGNRVWAVAASNPLIQRPRWIVHKRPWIAREYYTNLPVGLQVPVGIKHVGMFPVVTCVRRKIRKMVMFALGKTGKGARQKKRHYGEQSKVRC